MSKYQTINHQQLELLERERGVHQTASEAHQRCEPETSERI
ncbi:hypothetical protein [Anoxybacteroides rupiense]